MPTHSPFYVPIVGKSLSLSLSLSHYTFKYFPDKYTLQGLKFIPPLDILYAHAMLIAKFFSSSHVGRPASVRICIAPQLGASNPLIGYVSPTLFVLQLLSAFAIRTTVSTSQLYLLASARTASQPVG
nr:MAG TPA: hypothetical protein [Caudoviricetes sp.]